MMIIIIIIIGILHNKLTAFLQRMMILFQTKPTNLQFKKYSLKRIIEIHASINEERSFLSNSPVNLGFDREQIATEMIFAGSNSLNSAS